MSAQQKYRSHVEAILQKQPQIKLFQLIYQVNEEKIPISEIKLKLQEINKLKKDGLLDENQTKDPKIEQKLNMIQAKDLKREEIYFILQNFEQEQFRQNVSYTSKKQTQNNVFNHYQEEQRQNIQGNQENNYNQKQEHQNGKYKQDKKILKQKNISQQTQKYYLEQLFEKQPNIIKAKTQMKQDQPSNIKSQVKKRYQTSKSSTKLKDVNNMSNLLQKKAAKKDKILTTPKKNSLISHATKKTHSILHTDNDQLLAPNELNTIKDKSNHKKLKIKSKQNQIEQNQDQNQNDNQSQSSSQTLPNFQNKQELQQFINDQKEHKNLFDDKPFQFVEQPIIIQRSPSYYSKQFEALRNKLRRYLIGAYHEYTLEAYSALDIKDQALNQKKHMMDLKIYLKFYKDFEVKQLLKVNQISKIFKQEAINRIWLDLDKFLMLNYKVIERKTPDNIEEGTINVVNQHQLIQRAKKFLSLFTKQRIKKFLKITKKQNLEKIISQYTKKEQNNSLIQGNKVQIVDKFLQRNFKQQIVKWYGKKQIDFQNINKLKKRIQGSPKKQSIRKHKSITKSIQKLRNQSEKNINQLKNILSFYTKDEEQNQLSANKIKQSLQNNVQSKLISIKSLQITSNLKKKLKENNHKGTISINKELKDIKLQNFQQIKPDTQLKQKLQISDDQPFLNAYFDKEQNLLKLNKKLNQNPQTKKLHNKQKIINSQKITKKLPNLMNNLDKNSKSSKNILQLPKIALKNNSVNKSASQSKLNHVRNYLKPKGNLEFQNQNLDEIRSRNNRSQPSKPKILQHIKDSSRKRTKSMKKLLDKSKNSIFNIEEQISKLPAFDLKNKNLKNLDPKQNQIINLKLYKFLQLKDENFKKKKDQNLKKKNVDEKNYKKINGQKDQINRDVKFLNNGKKMKEQKSVPLLKLKKSLNQLNQQFQELIKSEIPNKNFRNKNRSYSNNNIIKNNIPVILNHNNDNNIPKTNQQKKYQQQIYELLKYFKKRKSQDKLVTEQSPKAKGKGYLLDEKKKIEKKNYNGNRSLILK